MATAAGATHRAPHLQAGRCRRERDRPAFARTVAALAGDQWEATLATPVQQVAERLLNDGREMDPFVRRAVLNCLSTAA